METMEDGILYFALMLLLLVEADGFLQLVGIPSHNRDNAHGVVSVRDEEGVGVEVAWLEQEGELVFALETDAG